ncbi:Myb-like DNA-binding domain [Musa troglodytarum]|uniref:Myb-like DNA-binding domain n=1 Tax=Musa troglodytarum TaxID=320322 RepID=A0A9E7H8Y6_9LILI|nr:Myb-like DNA-binding domain [Musa troglodytarum]
MPNPHTAAWVAEFALRQPVEDWLANEIFLALPLPSPLPFRLHLRLRRLASDFSRGSPLLHPALSRPPPRRPPRILDTENEIARKQNAVVHLGKPTDKFDPMSAPEVEKVANALKSSCVDLHKVVFDPLPDAVMKATEVLKNRSFGMTNDVEELEIQRQVGASGSVSAAKNGLSHPSPWVGGKSRYLPQGIGIVDPLRRPRVPLPKLWEEDPIESSSDKSPTAKKITLPSPKREDFFSLDHNGKQEACYKKEAQEMEFTGRRDSEKGCTETKVSETLSRLCNLILPLLIFSVMLELLAVAPPILINLFSSLAPVASWCTGRERSRGDLRSVVVPSAVWITAREEYASAPLSSSLDLEIRGYTISPGNGSDMIHVVFRINGFFTHQSSHNGQIRNYEIDLVLFFAAHEMPTPYDFSVVTIDYDSHS